MGGIGESVAEMSGTVRKESSRGSTVSGERPSGLFGWNLALRNFPLVFKRLLGFKGIKSVENVMKTFNALNQ